MHAVVNNCSYFSSLFLLEYVQFSLCSDAFNYVLRVFNLTFFSTFVQLFKVSDLVEFRISAKIKVVCVYL